MGWARALSWRLSRIMRRRDMCSARLALVVARLLERRPRRR